VPFADFEGIPFYIAFTAAMYLVLPLTAVLHFAALLLVLGGYELLKSVQTDFVFSTKGALGLVAFSCVMSTVFFAVKQLRNCSATQLGSWLRLVLLAMAAVMAIEIGLTLDDLTQPAYQNYLLPIPAFTGLFTEPSHFGLALSPFVFMLLIDFDGFRRHVGLPYVGVLAVLAVLCPSGTLIGVTALAACISFSASALRMRIGGLAGVAIFGTVVGLAIIFVPEISGRVLACFPPMHTIRSASKIFQPFCSRRENKWRNMRFGIFLSGSLSWTWVFWLLTRRSPNWQTWCSISIHRMGHPFCLRTFANWESCFLFLRLPHSSGSSERRRLVSLYAFSNCFRCVAFNAC
jgi:hypothetical protein